jgi:hypothetical protein
MNASSENRMAAKDHADGATALNGALGDDSVVADVTNDSGRYLIVIHAGLKKAGSATIQSFASANERVLRERGVDFSPVGRALHPNNSGDQQNGHHLIAHALLGAAKSHGTAGILADLAAHRRRSGAHTTILSSEMLEGCKAEEIVPLHAALADDDVDFKIIFYLRNYVDLIQSSYAQKVKYGKDTYDFDQFYTWRIVHERANYFNTVNNWARLFGWRRMHVRLLEPRSLLNGDLIDDFLDAASIDIRQGWVQTLARPGVVNVAPGWRVLEATRAIFNGRHGLAQDQPLPKLAALDPSLRVRKRLAKLAAKEGERLGWHTDKGRYLTREQAQACLRAFKESIAALNTALPEKLPRALSLPERGFEPRKFMPEAACIPPAELRDFYEGLTTAAMQWSSVRNALAGKASPEQDDDNSHVD